MVLCTWYVRTVRSIRPSRSGRSTIFWRRNETCKILQTATLLACICVVWGLISWYIPGRHEVHSCCVLVRGGMWSRSVPSALSYFHTMAENFFQVEWSCYLETRYPGMICTRYRWSGPWLTPVCFKHRIIFIRISSNFTYLDTMVFTQSIIYNIKRGLRYWDLIIFAAPFVIYGGSCYSHININSTIWVGVKSCYNVCYCIYLLILLYQVHH